MRKYLFLIAFAAILTPAHASEPDNTFGGWEFIDINYDFGKNEKWFIQNYFEHDNFQYQRFECWYDRVSLGYKILPWLKVNGYYDIMREPGFWTNRTGADITGTLKTGDAKISIRERYMYTWSPSQGTDSHCLRSRLKVAYHIPNSRFTPYLAIELFTWEKWRKTRHYVACDFDINKWMQLEWYYMYYAFDNKPAEHVIGIGLNFDFTYFNKK